MDSADRVLSSASGEKPWPASWLSSRPRSLDRMAWSSLMSSITSFAGVAARLSSSALAASSRSASVRPAVVSWALVSRNSSLPREMAETSMPPVDVVTPWSASLMYASTSLATSLKASERPIAIDTPAVPPSEAASEAAPAMASMPEASSACTVTLAASMPPTPSPSI